MLSFNTYKSYEILCIPVILLSPYNIKQTNKYCEFHTLVLKTEAILPKWLSLQL